MNPEDAQRDRQALEIFGRAVEMASAEARMDYLEGACGEDERLKARVEALLSRHVEDSFLEQPAGVPGLGATVVLPITEKAGNRIGRYKLLEQIGEGGCGVVYVAEQEEPVRRRVALKVIKLGMDTKSVIARFEAERQALALMDHPNIAKVLDAGATETGRPYFVMELVRGIKITDYCDQNNLPTRERLDLFIQVCHAIQHAHQKGIIHRDIKPSNILVTLHDGVPVPKVIDFGIAKATTQQRLTDKTLYTAFEQFIGTPAYMSPEQAEMSGLDIDTRSDIYALGVLLYELLTSKTPFDASTLMAAGLDQMRRIIREQEPVRPSTRLGTMVEGELTTTAKHRHAEPPKLIHLLQGDLDWIVMKALEKDRTRRYETANGMALDVERHLKHEPVVARPPSTAYRVQKFVRRNKLMVTAAATVAAALVAGITVSTWQAIRATRAEERAERALEKESAERRKAEQARTSEGEQRRLAVQAGELAQRNLYVANMNMAQLAWDQNNIGRLRQALEDARESPYRGFEWYYWQPKTHLGLKTLRGHTDIVQSVAFSPDGKRIATGSFDRIAKVWEVATGQELFALKGHAGPVVSVAFSPDGRRIVSGSQDNTARVWDAATGRALLTLWGHTHWIWCVAFSPDGQRIVTGSEDDTAKVWEVNSGRVVLTLKGHTDKIFSVAFSPNGQRIVTASPDNTARVWEADDGRELLRFTNHTAGVMSAAFSPDGRRIVTGGIDMTARAWDVATGQELLNLRSSDGPVAAVAFFPDGQRIVTGNDENTATVWEAASGSKLFTVKGHGGPVVSVAASPDGQRFVTASGDTTAKLWDATNGTSAEKTGGNLVTLKGHRDIVHTAAFSPDGRRVVTGSEDGTARIWDAATGQVLLTLKGHSNGIYSASFSLDGQRIVTGSWDSTARVWEADSGRELLTIKGHSMGINSAAFSPDGRRIATGSWDKTARVWEAATGRELLTLRGHASEIETVAFSADGKLIATGSDDRTAIVWDAVKGNPQLTLKGHAGRITWVAFSPDGQRIATGSYDKKAKVWEAATGKELLTLAGHSDWVWSAAFSPDGRRIVTGSYDRTARLWETASGRELLSLKAHGDAVKSAAFSPDGRRIVTASWDKTAQVWGTPQPEQIAAWQEEERTFAALQRECAGQEERDRILRARDSIKQWLLLAPIPLAPCQSAEEAVDLQQMIREAGLKPKSEEATSIGGVALKWRKVTLTNEVIDFNVVLGQPTTQSVAYVVCYLGSEAEQAGLRMLVGSDDQAKIYLNGKEIYKSSIVRYFFAEQDTVTDLTLNAGLNVLVFKVVNGDGPWLGSIRFTDAQGNPVKGIRVTLNPEGKDLP